MLILGLSGATGHDPAACLIEDGRVVAMIEEERLTRIKHGRDQLPIRSIIYCLSTAGVTLDEIDCIAASWNPDLDEGEINFRNYIPHLLAHDAFRGAKIPKIEYVEHHLAHAASAFYSSGFPDAAILVVDGAGEDAATSIGFGRNSDIQIDQKIGIRHSLGHFYSFAAEHTGLGSGNEGKLMGLAAYGSNIKEIDLLEFDSEGYHFNLKGISDKPMRELWEPLYEGWRTWFTQHFGPPNTPSFTWDPNTSRPKRVLELPPWCADLAATVQNGVTQTMLHLAAIASSRYMTRRLVIAGGVGLNCTANGAISKSGLIDELFVVPAAHDAGGALGAAMYIAAQYCNVCPLSGADLGPEYTDDFVVTLLRRAGLHFNQSDNIANHTAGLLTSGKLVGWFQGRSEIGPRALGNRSILALPDKTTVRDRVNRLKGREAWRPLSPSILASAAPGLLTDKRNSPFMLMASGTTDLAKKTIPAAIHVDGTARPQFVTKNQGKYYDLIREVQTMTGIPAILNTSFNTEDEPIVCTPQDAIRTFVLSDLDALVIGNFLVEKTSN